MDYLNKALAMRGIVKEDEINRFLNPSVNDFHDPFLLDDMRIAISRIKSAIRYGEKIRIYGDYDADGISSTALMIKTMGMLGANFDYYIPNRYDDGYGLHNHLIDHAKSSGVSLIVTVDTGISAVGPVAYAKSLGIDVVVTDHHEPPEVLPKAYAIVNPKKSSCTYPFEGLAGVGVAFKVAHALLGAFPENLLEYAVIGTVADLMPLTGENRALTALGLRRMIETDRVGIRTLVDSLGLGGGVKASDIGYKIAPRINASGRMSDPGIALRLLITDDAIEADELVLELNSLNAARQKLVEDCATELIAAISNPADVIIAYNPEWKAGIVGLIASRLVEEFKRPSIALYKDKKTGLIKGSARSYAGFDMYESLKTCSDLLVGFGGHKQAAGVTLENKNLVDFNDRMVELAKPYNIPEFALYTHHDFLLDFGEATPALVDEFAMLEPCGMGNPVPFVKIENLHVLEVKTMGQGGKHLKLLCSDSGNKSIFADKITLIGFGISGIGHRFTPGCTVDVIGTLDTNSYFGPVEMQVVIKNIEISKPAKAEIA